MLVAFLDQQSDVLTPQRKGVLFELLARRLATQAGYRDVVLRAKHASLEYDIEGRSVLHGLRLTGEAKAHDANIAGQVIAAFVGKLMPLAAAGPVHGLFISTSGFTAEAQDYLEVTLPTLSTFHIELRTLVGSEIPQFFADEAGYVSDDTLRSRVRELYELELIDSWLVCGETGEFLVATCGPDNVSAATSFAAFKTDGTELALDGGTARRLELQVVDLGGLELITTESDLTADRVRVERLPAVAAGASSFDYRFPAPPEYFIGRTGPLDELASTADEARHGSTAVRAVQVLSRSGVGKSSLLLKTPTAIDAPFVTIDGRSMRTPADVRLLVTEAVMRANQAVAELEQVPEPRSLEEAGPRLEGLGRALTAKEAVLVIQVDQFEEVVPGLVEL